MISRLPQSAPFVLDSTPKLSPGAAGRIVLDASRAGDGSGRRAARARIHDGASCLQRGIPASMNGAPQALGIVADRSASEASAAQHKKPNNRRNP